jgi:hypothetical protein
MAHVGGIALKPGDYQIVFLERGDGTGDLHFFAGKKVKPEKSLVHAKVETANQSGNPTTVQVSYKEENGVVLISEIQTPTRIFRVAS